MAQKSVITTVKRYTRKICRRFPVKKVVLFGSFARGKGHPNSDIDVAVILKKDPADLLSTQAALFRIGMDIDVRIEPVIVAEGKDPSGFVAEILRYGKTVYPVG